MPGRIYKGAPHRLDRILVETSPVFLVTFNTHRRRPLLANPDVHRAFLAFTSKSDAQGISVGRYVIMPDHIHVFVGMSLAATRSLSQWIAGLKQAIGRALLAMGKKPLKLAGQSLCSFWQPGFHDHLLRSDESYAKKWEYVRMNPVRAGLVSGAEEWSYSGEVTPLQRG